MSTHQALELTARERKHERIAHGCDAGGSRAASEEGNLSGRLAWTDLAYGLAKPFDRHSETP